MSNNFTAKAENALNRAVKLAEEFGHTYIGTEHVLLSLSEDETCCASILMKKYKITAEKLCFATKEYSGLGSPGKLTSKDTTPKCRRLLESSYKTAKKYSSERIGTEHLLLAILEERECVATKILTKIEADLIGLKDSVVVFLRTSGRGTIYAEPVSETSIPNLLKYGRNITALAEKGELDPVIGREKETDRVIRILSRRSKNNPCLIGEAGVGKTAIIEGLAERIAEGRVPEGLIGKTIISLDLTSMVAGAKYRGDFEERIKNIMAEVSKNKSVILFIDEIHTIVGAGSAEGAIDAANIMKPELSRGDIQLIGATTLSEYRKYIEKDSALERRFQPVVVEPSTVEGTIEILNGLKDRFERHHNVIIDEMAISAAAKLSERYIQDRFLPDKAIDLLDEACALASVFRSDESDETQNIRDKIKQTKIKQKKAINNRDYELAINLRELEKIYTNELNGKNSVCINGINKPTVNEDHILKIIKEITGICLDVNRDDSKNKIFERLSAAVVGQNEAVEKLSEAVTRSFAGINSPERPRGVFLFLGESGVGKTELAIALTKELFDSTESMIRYDMSEYSEPSAVTKLIGSAPGYVGYDENNSPLERIRKHPYSVVLFDEIEKAHPDVLSLFLQIFDTGYLTDATGRRISFRNAYIIMTSNVGYDKLLDGKSTGFITSNTKKVVEERLKGYFKDEFINRIDEIVVFCPLDISALKEIAKMKITVLQKRVSNIMGIQLEIENEVYDKIAKKALTPQGFGARPLNRLIVSLIENKVASMIVDGSVSKGDSIKVAVENDNVICYKKTYVLN